MKLAIGVVLVVVGCIVLPLFLFPLFAVPNEGSGNSSLMTMLLIGGVVYFLPTIIGWKKLDIGAIFAVNLLLGWTLVGWVVALAWALKHGPQRVKT